MITDSDKKDILGKFVIDNEDLELLESNLLSFNIFEAIGVVRQEIRHSSFIAFLLNPLEKHRLDDLFLKKLLISTLTNSNDPPFKPIEIDILDLQDVEVRREWKNIDILIKSPINKFIFIIENKIDSLEHSNQLERYSKIVNYEFPEYKKVFLYLTKEGYSASKEEWLSLSYGEVANIIESICTKYKSLLSNDIYTIMNHYVNLLRRHIMTNSDIAILCQKIYRQHQQALDLIYEHRPDLQSEISIFVKKMIQDDLHKGIETDDFSKRYIRFAPTEWDDLEFQKTCKNWTKSNRLILFEFVNEPQYLGLHLVIGPGDNKIKDKILNALSELDISSVMKVDLKENGWNHVIKTTILDSLNYVDADLEIIKKSIRYFWFNYINNELDIIRKAICSLKK